MMFHKLRACVVVDRLSLGFVIVLRLNSEFSLQEIRIICRRAMAISFKIQLCISLTFASSVGECVCDRVLDELMLHIHAGFGRG